MLFELDSRSTVPIYGQLTACVRRAIGTGALTPGSKLPPARQLARELKVNRHTVIRAYSELRDEGLLELRPRRGAIVTGGETASLARIRGLLRDLLAEADERGLTTADLTELMESMR
jgi:DNA-binding transcriptional regulator YhcF (GntR family)